MKDQHEQIDIGFARCCLVANKKNCITAHYYLLKKKKQLMQESFSDFSMLQILDADADLQITTQKNVNYGIDMCCDEHMILSLYVMHPTFSIAPYL